MQTQESSAWGSFPQGWTEIASTNASTIDYTTTGSSTGGIGSTRSTSDSFKTEDHSTRGTPVSFDFTQRDITNVQLQGRSTDSGGSGGLVTDDFTVSEYSNQLFSETSGDTSESRTTTTISGGTTTDGAGVSVDDESTAFETDTSLAFTGEDDQTGTGTSEGSGGAKTTTVTETHETTWTVPSTTSAQTQTGEETSDTTSTQTCNLSHTFTENVTRTTTSITSISWTHTDSEATTNTDSTVTTTNHRWIDAYDTLLLRDFNLPEAWNGERIWTQSNITFPASVAMSNRTQVGMFTDFWESVADSVATVTVSNRDDWTDLSNTERTFEYSSSTSTIGTDTVTGESLDGFSWDSTEAKSSSSVRFNGVTDTSTTIQVTGYDTNGQFTTDTESIPADSGFTQEWNTWWASTAKTDTTTIHQTIAETIAISSNNTISDAPFYLSVGLVTTTTEAEFNSSTTYAWTDWATGNTRLVDRFSKTDGSTFADGASGRTTINSDGYDATTHDWRPVGPEFELADQYRFTFDPWTMEETEPIGFFGFGGGWTAGTEPVHFTVTASLVSGGEFEAFTVDTNWPAAGIRGDASAFRTDRCGISSYAPLLSAGKWELSGSGTGISLFATWSSVTQTGTDTSQTEVSTTAATYEIGVSSAITGEFFNTGAAVRSNEAANMPLHRPGGIYELSRVSFGGQCPVTNFAHVANFPAGRFSYTEGDGTSTTASSVSSGEGPWTTTFSAGNSVHGWFEPAVRMRHTNNPADAGWITAWRFSEEP